MMLEWFKSAKSKKIPVSGPMLKEKVLEIVRSLGVEDFGACNDRLEL